MRAIRTVGIRELRQHATQIMRLVRVKHTTVQITYRGKVIAKLTPVREEPFTAEELSNVWTDLDRLAKEIGARWVTPISAVEAVREGRRDL